MTTQKITSSPDHQAGLVIARAWLERFPANRRSAIANWHHYAVRAGAHTPESVLLQVQQTIYRRLQWTRDPATGAHLSAVVEALTADRAGALAYAQSVIDYEHLPYAERQRAKAERATNYVKEAMRGKDVTPAQRSFLLTLGYAGDPPEDRAAANALIDKLKRGRGL
jgi:hypothetical protein